MSFFHRLRLTKLNEEMRESEMASNDDTYNEVFRDYTQLAHSHPERLVRARHNNNEGNYSTHRSVQLGVPGQVIVIEYFAKTVENKCHFII